MVSVSRHALLSVPTGLLTALLLLWVVSNGATADGALIFGAVLGSMLAVVFTAVTRQPRWKRSGG